MSRSKLRSRNLLLYLILIMISFTAHAATGEYLPKGTVYPRLIRLAHGSASSNGSIIASTTDRIFESKDDGRSFTFLGEVPVRAGSKLRCCETLFELPQAVGSLHAGTLLYAASYTSGTTPAIEVYTSTDEGSHWAYHSTPVIRGSDISHGGLWEPQFMVTGDGALAMFWSDETYSCCSQKLMQIHSCPKQLLN